MSEVDRGGGSLLVICTANVCRSPLAMRLLEDAFQASERLRPVRVGSAGTRTEGGLTMCPLSAEALPDDDYGRFAQSHRSRAVTKELVREADLVLTMEREQRSVITQLAPGSQAKVFTLREVDELVQLLEERPVTPRDLAGLASALHSVRAFAPLPPEPPKRRWFRRPMEAEDPLTIVDGHGLDDDRHRAAALTVRETAGRVGHRIVTLVER